MSIKARLVITISVLVAVAFALTGVVTVQATRGRMIDRVDESLFAYQIKPDGKYGDDGSRNGPPGANETGASDFPGGDPYDGGPYSRGMAMVALDGDGAVTESAPSGFSDDPDPLPDLSGLSQAELEVRSGDVFTVGAVDDADFSYRVLLLPAGGDGYVAFAAPLDDVEATIRNLTLIIATLGVIVVALVIGIVWYVIRRGLAPIDSMISTAGMIAGGDLSHRVDVEDRAGEVGRLGRALNAMLSHIESSFAAKEASEQRLRQFVGDASHELRTPLTSIRGYAELYRSGAMSSPEDVERVMQRIESEGKRMGRLVEDLLLLARLDQGRPLRMEPVDLVALVDGAVMDARAISSERAISYSHDSEALVIGDADRLQQVVENLLANAGAHTPPRTPVQVEVRAGDDTVTLSVADEGPGIAPEDAERIFDRFYRADVSRARASGGVGLGLSIVASIVEAHGGEVRANSTPGAGATFTISLARALPDAASRPDERVVATPAD